MPSLRRGRRLHTNLAVAVHNSRHAGRMLCVLQEDVWAWFRSPRGWTCTWHTARLRHIPLICLFFDAHISCLQSSAAVQPVPALQDALRLLRDMRAMGVAPTAVTFNTLMDACLARGAPVAVPRLFRALLAAGLAPDAVSYTTLVAAFARLGRPDDAVSPL